LRSRKQVQLAISSMAEGLFVKVKLSLICHWAKNIISVDTKNTMASSFAMSRDRVLRGIQ
jgi:hypothetical protein